MTTRFDGILWVCDVHSAIKCKGSGSSGSSGTTTTENSTVNPPPQVLAAYQTAMGASQSAASAPLQQYSGPEIASFTPDQLQAFQTVSGTAGAQQPYLNQASTDINNSTSPLWSNVQQFSPSAVQQYQSPYTSDVLNSTMAAENNQDAQQQQQVVGNAISSGAWGGDRSAVAQAQLAGQQAIANNATNANIENTGYNTALGEFNNQQQTQLSANEANDYLSSQAGFGNINLAQNAVSLPIAQASAENATGNEEQALGQSILNVPYEQFLQQQAYPFQTAQFLTDAAEGLGPGQGQSGTSSTTAPAASATSQAAGGILGLGSLGYGLSQASGGRIPRANGGNVRQGYASGGLTSNIPDFSIDFIPSGNSPGTKELQLLNSPRTDSGNGQSMQGVGQSIQGLTGIGKSLGGLFGGSSGTSDGNALDPGNSSTSVGGEGNILDTFSSGAGEEGGNAVADEGSSAAADEGSSAIADEAPDLLSSFFKDGGKIPQFDSGGSIKHDNTWMSTVGDWGGTIVGSIYGGPIGGYVGGKAGSDAGGTLGDLFGGNWDAVGSDIKAGPIGEDPMFSSIVGDNSPGQGNSPQLGGNFSNTSLFGENDNPGNGQNSNFLLARGGRTHFDDGGTISPITGAAPTAYDSGQLQQNQYQQIAQLPLDKLQQLQTRLPPNTAQGQLVQKAIKQKQFMPQGGGSATAGLSAPTAPQAGSPQVQNPQVAQSGMATGGRPRFDDGGDTGSIPPPDSPEIQVLQDVANEDKANGARDAPQDGVGTSAALQQYRAQNGMKTPPIDAQRAQMGLPVDSMQVASNDTPEDDDEPSSSLSQPVENYKPPSSAQRAKVEPWEALAAAGFGMMAGTSPQAGVNIGKGALLGMQNLEEQKKEVNSVNQEADRLAQQASQFNTKQTTMSAYEKAQVDKENRQLDQQGAYQKAQIANMQQERGKPISDGYGGFLQLDQTTGKYVPVASSGIGGQSINNLYNVPKDADGNPLKGDAFLATLPPAVAQQAKSYLAGNSPPPTGFASKDPKLAAAWQAAQQADDSFNANAGTRYKTIQDFANPNGKTNQTIKSQNVTMEHIQTMRDAVDALHNGNIPAFNAATNMLAKQTGQPEPTNLELGKQILGDEISKAVLGTTGASADREGIKNSLSANASNAQAYGALDQAEKYMAGQASGVEQSYKSGTGLNNYRDRFMTPPAKTLIDKYYPNGVQLKQQSNQQSSSTPQSSSLPQSLNGINGLQFSQTRQQYRDGAGNIYDMNGNKVQ